MNNETSSPVLNAFLWWQLSFVTIITTETLPGFCPRQQNFFYPFTPNQLQHFSYKLKQLDIAINKTTRIHVVPVFDPDNGCYAS